MSEPSSVQKKKDPHRAGEMRFAFLSFSYTYLELYSKIDIVLIMSQIFFNPLISNWETDSI